MHELKTGLDADKLARLFPNSSPNLKPCDRFLSFIFADIFIIFCLTVLVL